MHTARSTHHYATSQVQPGHIDLAFLATVSQPGFIYRTVCAMDPLQHGLQPAVAAQCYQQLVALDNAIQVTKRADKTIEVAAPLLVPLLTRLQEQKDAIEVCMTAVSTAVEQSFTEDYYTDTGYNLDPFFDHVSDLRQAADVYAEVQRQVAIQAPAPAPAPAPDGDMQD